MRLATAIFLSVFALGLVLGIGYTAYVYWENAQAKVYESIKVWKVDFQPNLQFSLVARTKLSEGRFYVKVDTSAYPQYLSPPYLKAQKAEQVLVLDFVDADGFKVYSKPIEVKDFSTNVDANGKPKGLNFEGNDIMSVSTYASISKLELRWTIDTTIPPSVAWEDVPSKVLLDHCAPNLTKSERLKRLAQHGEVRQTSDGSYQVGYRSLTFFSGDNSLLHCR